MVLFNARCYHYIPYFGGAVAGLFQRAPKTASTQAAPTSIENNKTASARAYTLKIKTIYGAHPRST